MPNINPQEFVVNFDTLDVGIEETLRDMRQRYYDGLIRGLTVRSGPRHELEVTYDTGRPARDDEARTWHIPVRGVRSAPAPVSNVAPDWKPNKWEA